nr:carboxyl transferase domain-containing protein [Parvularcula maris]
MGELTSRLAELNGRGAALSARKAEKFAEAGKLLPRDRLAALLDPGSPFLTIGNLTGYMVDTDKEERSVPGSTIIAGIGTIAGRRCMVAVDDSAIKAGALTVGSAQRIIRCERIALRQGLPFVHLVESAGGDLKAYTVEGFVEGGEIFANLARLSAAGIPTIAVLHGSSTAGGAYMPGLSDYVVAVEGEGKAFLAGPPLLKAATGEIAGDDELGGAKMHAEVSGLADILVPDDREGVLAAREVIGRLPPTPEVRAEDYTEPLYPAEELLGIVPADYRSPFDAREVVARIVDGSDFTEFKERIGSATVCLFALIMGHRVGILTNNGPIDNQGAHKATQFLQLCDSSQTPVLFLQNTTGYMVGVETERGGMIKNGSKMIQAVANIRVPRITLQIGASFGAGNYGMCGRGFDPDFCFLWPNAKTGVMGGEQAGRVMRIVAEDAAKAKGEEPNEQMLAFQEAALKHHFDGQSDAFTSSGRNCDDGVIDPRDSRAVLGMVLAVCAEAKARTLHPNAFGVARM